MTGSAAKAWLLSAAISACMPQPEANVADAPSVLVEPLALDGVERVARFSIMSPETPIDPDDAWLFRGELSDYHLGRINRRELPETLNERRVPVNAWFDPERAQTLVAPLTELTPGGTYTLAAPGWGRLAQVDVNAMSLLSLMQRAWPPTGVAVGRSAIFCGEVNQLDTAELDLEPSRAKAQLLGFVGSLASGEGCVEVCFPANGLGESFQLLPPLAAGVLWDPTPLEFAADSEAAMPALDCLDGELALGGACASVFDDRMVVRNGVVPLLFAFEQASETILVPCDAGASFEWRGLAPDALQTLRGSTIDVYGSEQPFALELRTLPPKAHLVLNEVLANALGPEPESEWIELMNDGTAAAELAGLRLADGGGETELPPASIAPGGFAVLVREDFAENGSDVPIALDATIVRLPQLGKNGLSNSGEPLSLLDADGRVLSRFPALASPHAGVSIARRSPNALESDPRAFGEHAAPNASPGAANTLAD
jgi:hypothetical protein